MEFFSVSFGLQTDIMLIKKLKCQVLIIFKHMYFFFLYPTNSFPLDQGSATFFICQPSQEPKWLRSSQKSSEYFYHPGCQPLLQLINLKSHQRQQQHQNQQQTPTKLS